MKKAIVYTVMFVLLQLAVTFLVTLVWVLISGGDAADGLSARMTAIGSQPVVLVVCTAVFNLLTAALYMGLKWAPVGRSYAQSRPWDVMAWCIVAAVGTLVPSLWMQEQMPELPDTVSQTMMQMMHVPGCFFVIAILAPLTEELVFRGAVLRALLRKVEEKEMATLDNNETRRTCGLSLRQWTAVAVSALLFALVHGNPAQMPHAFLIGVLLGWLFARTGSVLPGIVLHVTNNTLAYLLAAAYPSDDIRLIDIFGGQQRAVVMAVAFSLMLLLPALYQLHIRLRRV